MLFFFSEHEREHNKSRRCFKHVFYHKIYIFDAWTWLTCGENSFSLVGRAKPPEFATRPSEFSIKLPFTLKLVSGKLLILRNFLHWNRLCKCKFPLTSSRKTFKITCTNPETRLKIVKSSQFAEMFHWIGLIYQVFLVKMLFYKLNNINQRLAKFDCWMLAQRSFSFI